MDSLDVSGLAQQIAARAMEEAKGIINRAFDTLAMPGIVSAAGRAAWDSESPVTLAAGRKVTAKRGRKTSTETMRIVDALRGGMTNKDAAAKYRRTPQYMTILRTRYGLPKRAYRKGA